MSAARRSKDPAIRRAAEKKYQQQRKARRPEVFRAKARRKKQRYKALGTSYSRQQMLRKYDLTEEEYEDMFIAQGRVCAICPNPPRPNRKLAVDHCHETGRVRGLLCERCNVGLGMFKDNETLLLNAIGYLQQ